MVEIVEIGPHTLVWGEAKDALHLRRWDRMMGDPPYLFRATGGGQYRKDRPQGFDNLEEMGLHKGFDQAWLMHELWSCGAPAAMIFCHNDQVDRLIRDMKTPFRRIALLAWHKTNPQPMANKHYLPDTEFIVHGWNEGAHPPGRGGKRNPGNLYDLKRYIETKGGKNEFGHPTQKPLEVMTKFLINLGGETICDPFMGTGSTGVAAHALGRRFFGIEKERRWFDVAVARMREVTGVGA